MQWLGKSGALISLGYLDLLRFYYANMFSYGSGENSRVISGWGKNGWGDFGGMKMAGAISVWRFQLSALFSLHIKCALSTC